MPHTKIVATIGPASKSQDILAQMIEAGMTVARLNFSHGTYSEHKEIIKTIRSLSKKMGVAVAILQDVPGPKVRVGKLPDDGLTLVRDEECVLTCDPEIKRYHKEDKKIPVNFPGFCESVKTGHRLLLDDGKIVLRAQKKRDQDLVCKVMTGGLLTSRKGLAAPDSVLSTSAITEADREAIKFGIEQDVDYIAISFVRDADDLVEAKDLVRSLKGEGIKIIAKIERREAVDNFDKILAVTDGVMVARGDLALEVGVASVPVIQKDIVKKTQAIGKPVIVATQMLESMIEKPEPTRAEVSDIANAVIDHADAVMLSAETATGLYPVKTIKVMAATIKKTEASSFDDLPCGQNIRQRRGSSAALANATCQRAQDEEVAVVVLPTSSGSAAGYISWTRLEKPILAFTNKPRTYRQLALLWGIIPVFYEDLEKMFDGEDDQELLSWIDGRIDLHPGQKILVVESLEQDLAVKDSLRVITFK